MFLLYINFSSDFYFVNVGNLIIFFIVMYVFLNIMFLVLFDIELFQLIVIIGIIENIWVFFSGSNIGCVYENEFLVLKFDRKFNLFINICQVYYGQLDFGIVINIGMMKWLLIILVFDQWVKVRNMQDLLLVNYFKIFLFRVVLWNGYKYRG